MGNTQWLCLGLVLPLWGNFALRTDPQSQHALPNSNVTLRVALFTFGNPSYYTLFPSAVARVWDPGGAEIATCFPNQPLQVRRGHKGVEVLGRSFPYVDVVPESGCLTLSSGAMRRTYRGWIRLLPQQEGLLAVNLVALEAYVAGVVGAEMPPKAPLEALKAQAVAVRSFAVHQAQKADSRSYDLVDTPLAQMYKGVEAETPSVLQAVTQTANEILLYGGRPALAMYHSASGGVTASVKEVFEGEEVPYLCSVEDRDETGKPYEGDAPPWVWEVNKAELASLLLPLGWKGGEVLQLKVLERGESGRVTALQLWGTGEELVLKSRTLRGALGSRLPSTFFELESTPQGWRFIGRGRGHGVGMSQLGAIGRANRGQSYLRILQAYYPGTTVVRVLDSPLLLVRRGEDACRLIPVVP